MKFSKQIFVIFLVMFTISCAADSSGEKQTVVPKKAISKTAPTQNQSQALQKSSNQPEAQKQSNASSKNISQLNTSQSNTSQSNQSSKPIKARYNAGTANHLGGQLGGKLCKCLKSEDATKCAEINNRINDVKKSMSPEILSIFEKSFNATKEEC